MSYSRINDSRKRRLVRGLEIRLKDHQGSLAGLESRIESERGRITAEYEGSATTLQQAQMAERHAAITAWDVQREEIYLRSDRLTWGAIRSESRRVQELNEQHKISRQQAINHYQSARQSLEQQYEELKPKPAKQLERYLSVIQSRRSEAEEVVEQYRHLMIDRSVTIPTLQESDVKSSDPLPTSMQSALDAMQPLIESMKQSFDRIRRDRWVRLSGSITPWLMGLLPGLIVGVILWQTMRHQLYVAIGVTLATLFLAPVILMLSLVPRVRKRMVEPYRELIRNSERLNRIAKHGQHMAEAHCRQEQARLLAEFKERQKRLEDEHRIALEKLDAKVVEEQEAVKHQQSELRRKTALECSQSIEMVDRQQSPNVDALISRQQQKESEHRHAFEANTRALDEQQGELRSRFQRRLRTGSGKAQEWLDQHLRLAREAFPGWEDEVWRTGQWPRSLENTVLPLGICQVSIAPDFESPLVIDFDWLHRGSLVIEADSDVRKSATDVVQSLLARAFTGIPIGNLQATIIDPEGLGKDFGWLMQLADADPRLVGHRVWTQHAKLRNNLRCSLFKPKRSFNKGFAIVIQRLWNTTPMRGHVGTFSAGGLDKFSLWTR